jgi:hypothetical protein
VGIYPIGVSATSIPDSDSAVKLIKEQVKMSDKERIAQLEKEIRELNARLPKHSTPPAMIIELEDLEDELEELKSRTAHDHE